MHWSGKGPVQVGKPDPEPNSVLQWPRRLERGSAVYCTVAQRVYCVVRNAGEWLSLLCVPSLPERVLGVRIRGTLGDIDRLNKGPFFKRAQAFVFGIPECGRERMVMQSLRGYRVGD